MLPLLKLSLLIVASLTICESSIIYSAQCSSECHSTYKKDDRSLSQCLTPCLETDLDKLKSCYTFCQSLQPYGSACHFSCKFLKELHYKGLLPGKCSLVKQLNSKGCGGNRDCTGLTKCCYNYCEEISIPGEGVTVTVSNITSTSMSAHWQKSHVEDAIYIVQGRQLATPSIYYDESDWEKWRQLEQLSDTTRIRLFGIHPGAKLQLRIAIVDSSGLQSIGPPTPMVRTLFNASRPSGPQVRWVEIIQTYKQDAVEVILSWLPPEQLDVPVHRYRIYWREFREISQISTGKVTDKKPTNMHRVQGTQLNYTIKGLQKDKNYLVEIQAICLWKKKRLKGPKVAVNVSTSGMKDANEKKIDMISNSSKLKRRHFNFTSQDFEGIKVVVEQQKVRGETTKTPQGVGKQSNNARDGTKSGIWTSMLLFSTSCVIYLFVWRY